MEMLHYAVMSPMIIDVEQPYRICLYQDQKGCSRLAFWACCSMAVLDHSQWVPAKATRQRILIKAAIP
jgi:hypothetical protein